MEDNILGTKVEYWPNGQKKYEKYFFYNLIFKNKILRLSLLTGFFFVLINMKDLRFAMIYFVNRQCASIELHWRRSVQHFISIEFFLSDKNLTLQTVFN